jgi:NAD+ diphosphatase
MPSSSVYLFQGNSLVVPESIKDEEMPGGVDPDTVKRDFGGLDVVSIPPLGNGPPINGFLFRDGAALPAAWRPVPVRQLLSALTAADTLPGSRHVKQGDSAERLLRAYHVLQWRNESVYCGSCGEKNGDSPDELARLCPRCGRIEYPRISPAVIVLIMDDTGRILLAHNKKFKNNIYSLIAGFAEAGESLEAAACREIKEELDIDVKDLSYVRSQSWPFPNSLMVGFTARYAGGELKPDGNEIADARWFNRGTIMRSIAGTIQDKDTSENSFIPELPAPGSISRHIIDKWVSGDFCSK